MLLAGVSEFSFSKFGYEVSLLSDGTKEPRLNDHHDYPSPERITRGCADNARVKRPGCCSPSTTMPGLLFTSTWAQYRCARGLHHRNGSMTPDFRVAGGRASQQLSRSSRLRPKQSLGVPSDNPRSWRPAGVSICAGRSSKEYFTGDRSLLPTEDTHALFARARSSSTQATPRGGSRARSPIPVVIFLTPLSLNSKIKRIDRPTFLLLAPY